MVTLVFLCRRRPDVTHARYAALLLDGHVPLALRHHPTLRRYVVNVVEQSLADAPPLDSIGELSFDSLADYEERLYDSGEGRKVIARDVAGFMGGADAYVTTTARADVTAATPRLGERSPGVKLVVCVPPPAGVSREPFAERWARAVEGLAVRSQIAGSVERRLESGAVDYAGIGALHLEGEPPPGLLDELRRALGTIAAYRVAEYVQRR